MSTENFNSEVISKRIRQIGHYNEVLNHGISELEALHLRIFSGLVSNGLEAATETAFTLKEKNHKLAHAINKSLQELENILKQEMDNGTDIQNLVHEFVVVLRDSIRIFYDYRTVQEEFVKQAKISQARVTHIRNTHCRSRLRTGNRNPMLTFKRVIGTICICGYEFT